MTKTEYARKLVELDRLLNDPDVPMQARRVWALLAEIAQREQWDQDQRAVPPGARVANNAGAD
jgi:hypothetical protein